MGRDILYNPDVHVAMHVFITVTPQIAQVVLTLFVPALKIDEWLFGFQCFFCLNAIFFAGKITKPSHPANE